MIPLTEKCSLFKPYVHKIHGWCMGTKPETVNIIDMLLMPWQGDIQETIRNTHDEEQRKILKKRLWTISPSSIQNGGRGIDHITEHNGLMQFDIDPGKNLYLLEDGMLEEVKRVVCEIPYTLYCGISASGKGIWGLFRISHPHLHTQHFEAMVNGFKDMNIILDTAPSSPASLRFLSFDDKYYLNEKAEIFDKRIEPQIRKAKTFEVDSNNNTFNKDDGKELCAKFNAECTAAHMDEILTNFGFNYHSNKGLRYRYTRPDKSTKTGLSVDYHEKLRTLFCFSDAVPGLEYWKQDAGGWSCSPLTALLLYGCGGKQKADWAKAFNYIKQNCH